MRAYVINLKSRPDRWVNVQQQAQTLGLHVRRIEAVSTEDFDKNVSIIPSFPVAATWMSHQKAMQEFLDSDERFGLILEDDFLINKKNFRRLIKYVKRCEFDFLQFGWVYPHYLDYLSIKVWNLQDRFFKYVARVDERFVPLILRKKRSVVEQLGIQSDFVLHDIRAGAQAYLISRDFARLCLTLNNPIFLSTDGVFMAMGVSRNLQMARTRVNLVHQSGSPSSINLK